MLILCLNILEEELKESLELQKKFFDWMFKELLLKDQQQWYLINNRELDRHGGPFSRHFKIAFPY
jgi:hypothetical protein